MAANMQIKIQKMMVPYNKVNGEQSYQDYGFQKVWIWDITPTIPILMKSGYAPSGLLEINQPTTTSPTRVPGAPSNITGELMPMVRHIAGRTEQEATGMMD